MANRPGLPSRSGPPPRRVWIDPKGHIIKRRGPEDIVRSPFRTAIAPTGPNARNWASVEGSIGGNLQIEKKC